MKTDCSAHDSGVSQTPLAEYARTRNCVSQRSAERSCRKSRRRLAGDRGALVKSGQVAALDTPGSFPTPACYEIALMPRTECVWTRGLGSQRSAERCCAQSQRRLDAEHGAVVNSTQVAAFDAPARRADCAQEADEFVRI